MPHSPTLLFRFLLRAKLSKILSTLPAETDLTQLLLGQEPTARTWVTPTPKVPESHQKHTSIQVDYQGPRSSKSPRLLDMHLENLEEQQENCSSINAQAENKSHHNGLVSLHDAKPPSIMTSPRSTTSEGKRSVSSCSYRGSIVSAPARNKSNAVVLRGQRVQDRLRLLQHKSSQKRTEWLPAWADHRGPSRRRKPSTRDNGTALHLPPIRRSSDF